MESRVSCDVLVIGAGGAGLRAAIAAKRKDADVLIANKGPVGRSGATYYSVAEVGAYNVPDGCFDKSDNPEVFYEDMKLAAASTARLPLCALLAEKAESSMRELESMSSEPVFAREKGRHKVYRACFSSKARSHVVRDHFKPILATLHGEARRLGIRALENVHILDLIVDDARCVGAYALDADGAPLTIRAKSVILTTGGASRLFARNMYPPDITGDGYSMAYRAGALLANMEFLQVGVGVAHPAINLFGNYLWEAKPQLTNGNGRAFLADYVPAGIGAQEALWAKRGHFPFSSSDVSKYVETAIQSEINDGHTTEHGNVYLSFSETDFDDLLASDSNFSSMWPITESWYRNMGIDLRREPIEIACFAHAVNGGVLIDDRAESSLSGLFAAGEVAAGPHGADRLGGNMSVTCQVFGKIAGEQAAEFARKNPIAEEPVGAERCYWQRLPERRSPGRVAPAELLEELQTLSDRALLVVRDQEKLSGYLGQLDSLEVQVDDDVGVQDHRDVVRVAELGNLIGVGRMIASAALLRKESRGSHYRTDFPDQDPALAKCILVGQGGARFE